MKKLIICTLVFSMFATISSCKKNGTTVTDQNFTVNAGDWVYTELPGTGISYYLYTYNTSAISSSVIQGGAVTLEELNIYGDWNPVPQSEGTGIPDVLNYGYSTGKVDIGYFSAVNPGTMNFKLTIVSQ